MVLFNKTISHPANKKARASRIFATAVNLCALVVADRNSHLGSFFSSCVDASPTSPYSTASLHTSSRSPEVPQTPLRAEPWYRRTSVCPPHHT